MIENYKTRLLLRAIKGPECAYNGLSEDAKYYAELFYNNFSGGASRELVIKTLIGATDHEKYDAKRGNSLYGSKVDFLELKSTSGFLKMYIYNHGTKKHNDYLQNNIIFNVSYFYKYLLVTDFEFFYSDLAKIRNVTSNISSRRTTTINIVIDLLNCSKFIYTNKKLMESIPNISHKSLKNIILDSKPLYDEKSF